MFSRESVTDRQSYVRICSISRDGYKRGFSPIGPQKRVISGESRRHNACVGGVNNVAHPLVSRPLLRQDVARDAQDKLRHAYQLSGARFWI